MVNGPDDLIHINHPDHGRMIADRLCKPFSAHYDVCISRTKRNYLLGGALYQNYNGTSISMHVASAANHWLSRNALLVAFFYPFKQLKVDKIIGMVPTTNPHALQFDLKLGFVEETRVAGVVPGGDMVILSMSREQCRWLNWTPRGLQVIQHRPETAHVEPADPTGSRLH